MSVLANRYDFVLLFDVTRGNPNGDPDSGNFPRSDPETNHGLVSDVCIKRKVRDYTDLVGEPGKAIFIRSRDPLNPKIAQACEVNDLPTFRKKEGGGWDTKLAKERSQKDIRVLQEWLCAQYYDLRAFGGVLSTGPNAGQIRGPVQLAFAQSVEPIQPQEQAITRVTDVDKEEGEMGRKYIVPYGLYRAHGFVSAKLAERTGFSEGDLTFFWDALDKMFDHDRSAARGEMAKRRLVVFRHASALGNAAAHALFERVEVSRAFQGEEHPVGDPRTSNWPPARSFADYRVKLDKEVVQDPFKLVEVA